MKLTVFDDVRVTLGTGVSEAVTVDVCVGVADVDGVRVVVDAVPVSAKHSKLPNGQRFVPAA